MARQVLTGVLLGALLVYGLVLLLLWRHARAHPETVSMRDAVRMLPDLCACSAGT
jgi:hypothetical protein